MQAKLLNDEDEEVYALIFETGEDPIEGLTRFAREKDLSASSFTAIGAFSEAKLGYFDWESKEYEEIPVPEQTEVLALVGDIAVEGEGEGDKKVHAHVVLGKRDGAACGGHLLSARVRPTLEVILTESPGHLRRLHDPESGLALIRTTGARKATPARKRSALSGKKQAPRRAPRKRR